MNRWAVAFALTTISCAPCRARHPPAPPPRDELRTAAVHFRSAIGEAQTVEQRRALAKTILEVSALHDAAFRKHGDVYHHHLYPEPPYDCLAAGTCFDDYLRFERDEERRELPIAPPDPARIEELASTLTTLDSALEARARYVVDNVAAAKVAEVRGDHGATRVVYLLSAGHRADALRDEAVSRLLSTHPKGIRFVVVKRDDAPALIDALGHRVTAAAVVAGRLLLDMTSYEQWLEQLYPEEAFPRSEHLPLIDAHAHLGAGGAARLKQIVAEESLAAAVVAALPGPHANDDVLAVAGPRIVPFVTLDEDRPDAPSEMSALLARGAHGLKLITGHDDHHRKKGGPLDPAPLRAVFKDLEARSIPVLWHVNTHLYAEGFIRVLEAYPRLVVVNPHLGGYLSYAPSIVRALLERYPNLHFDLSFGAQPRYLRRALEDLSLRRDEWRALLIERSDRFLFGADIVVGAGTSRAHARMMYTTARAMLERETYALHFFPAAGASSLLDESQHHEGLRGLALPPDVLQKIYTGNAERLYGVTR